MINTQKIWNKELLNKENNFMNNMKLRKDINFFNQSRVFINLIKVEDSQTTKN